MNQLSWLLYWAEVSGRIGFNAGSLAFLSGMAAIFAGVAFVFLKALREVDGDALAEGLISTARSVMNVTAVVCLVMTLASWFAPSKQTIMLIAASEVGETVLASQEVQNLGGEAGALATDSLKLLRKYVTEQLGEAGK